MLGHEKMVRVVLVWYKDPFKQEGNHPFPIRLQLCGSWALIASRLQGVQAGSDGRSTPRDRA